MKRGDRITVRVYPDRTAHRVVWQMEPGWVMACREEVYDEAVRRGDEEPSSWMGFPMSDVIADETKELAA